MASKLKFLIIGYIAALIFLFLYSFTQVDLGLTLTEASWWQNFQNFFQRIGYFQRPLSTYFYISIVLLLFAFYIVFISLVKKKKISIKTTWGLIIFISLLFTFSYNAFSYDLFNYMFDARVITNYHQNPYLHKALDYPGDPMLSFMHWTHRTYPYGPVWLFLTVPFSFIGGNFFLLTFFMFKAIASLSYLGTAYFISKILKKVKAENALPGLVFFALNPLVIIEGLVSAHNDMAMIFFSVLSLYLLLGSKKALSFITLLASIGVKFATVFLLPAYIYYLMKNKIDMEKFFKILFFSMFIPLIFVTIRTNYQPWYLLYIIPFASLSPKKRFSIGTGTILSFFSLIQYVPFLYTGNWDKPIPQILFYTTVSGFIVYILYSKFGSLNILGRKMVE